MKERKKEWMNEWMNERKNEWKKEWMNECMNEWTNECMNEWMKEWMYERKKEWMNVWMNEWMNERKNDECMKERKKERKKEWMNEWMNEWDTKFKPLHFEASEHLPRSDTRHCTHEGTSSSARYKWSTSRQGLQDNDTEKLVMFYLFLRLSGTYSLTLLLMYTKLKTITESIITTNYSKPITSDDLTNFISDRKERKYLQWLR